MLQLFDHKYPYTDFHELNLDWIISKLIQMDHKLTNFVSLNTIKYADPISWNITTQYETNTVVVDPQTGIAYLSTKPVPAGVSIGDTDYWTEIFNLQQIIGNITENLTVHNNGQSPTLLFSVSEGDWIIWNNKLYVAKADLIAGTALIEGTNIDSTSVEELTEYYTDTVRDNLLAIIGDLADLQTSDTTSIVNAINSVLSDTAAIIGDINDLTTTDKTSIVNAINEVIANIGDLADLQTSDTTSIVNAINEIKSDFTDVVSVINKIADINDSYYEVNVLNPPDPDDVPLIADWTSASTYTDNTTRFQTLIDKYGQGTTYYFPAGLYGFSSQINIPYNQIKIYGNGSRYTRLHINSTAAPALFINFGDTANMNGLLNIEHIGFICDNVANACNAIKLNNPRTTHFNDILFVDFTNDIFYDAIVASSGQTSVFRWLNHSTDQRTTMTRMFYFNKASNTIFPNGIFIEYCHGSFGGVGRFIEGYAGDIWIQNCNIAYCVSSIYLTSPNDYVTGDVHINNNAFADCVGHVVVLRFYNRAVVITDNFIEQNSQYQSVLSAFRINGCNGVIISNNTIGTERNIQNHHIGVLITEGTCKDFVLSDNVGYLGAYVILSSSATMSDFIISDNFFAHVGSNTITPNAFYLTGMSNSMIHDNRFKNFTTINNAYTVTNVKTFHNMYESSSTINTPFIAADNYPI